MFAAGCCSPIASAADKLWRFDEYVSRGRNYSKKHDHREAVEIYLQATKKFPRNAQAYELLSEAYERVGRTQDQINALTVAIKLEPKSSAHFVKRAQAYIVFFQLENAVADAKKAVRLNPNSVGAYRTLAEAYDILNRFEQAIAVRARLLTLKTASAIDWSLRAKDYEMVGNFVLASADRQRAYKIASPAEKAYIDLSSPVSREAIVAQLGSGPIIMPFHYDKGGHICVTVLINRKPKELMLDTGCPWSELWEEAVPTTTKSEKFILSEDRTGIDTAFRVAGLRDLEIGRLKVFKMPFALGVGLPHHRTLSGFLGNNVLENFIVTVDYGKKQLTLSNAAEFRDPPASFAVPMMVRSQNPFCQILLDNKLSCAASVDTGGALNIASDALFEPIFSRPLNCTGAIAGPGIGFTWCENLRVKSLSLGPYSSKEPIFDVFPAYNAPHISSEVILGSFFLSKFKTVTFNFPGRKILFEPFEDYHDTALSLVENGLNFFAHDQNELAISSLTRAMELEKDISAGCLMKRARVYEWQKRYKEVILDMDAFLKLEPQSDNAYMMRASAYRKLGLHELADRDYRKARMLERP